MTEPIDETAPDDGSAEDTVTPPPAPDHQSPPPGFDPVESPAPVEPTRWRYTGPTQRIYTHIPATVDPGDVIDWHECPATDGAWEPTTAAANRLPDNHRPDPSQE